MKKSFQLLRSMSGGEIAVLYLKEVTNPDLP